MNHEIHEMREIHERDEMWEMHEGEDLLEIHEGREGYGKEIVYKEESYAILGACFEVYKDKGCGFLEAVYEECLEMELAARGVEFRAQAELPLSYKGKPLKQIYRADLVCCQKIVVELKSVSELKSEHRAQVRNYLKATGMKLGLLVNFGHHPKLEYERIVI